MKITQKELKKFLKYDKETGTFSAVKKKGVHKKNGIERGWEGQDGYLHIRVNRVKYKGHRLAWLYTYGYLPKEIDHINHNKMDNRVKNLRDVSHRENMRNQKKYKSNKSGATGVYWHSSNKRWIAQIRVDGKSISLGSFTQFHEAVNARKLAEVAYGFHENHAKDM